jgi:TolB-like protein
MQHFIGGRLTSGAAKYVLSLLGPFRLSAPDGQRIDVSSKKGQALIAMLAMAGGGERTRSWLQMQLWGSRGADQAQASLRSELSGLRNRVNAGSQPLLMADHSRIWLDLSLVEIDARSGVDAMGEEFLEGLDVAGEDGFEDWLREERARHELRNEQRHEQRQSDGPHSRNTEIVQTKVNQSKNSVVAGPMDFAALPAIAVLPFANNTDDHELDFLAEGLSEDLIDRLSRLRWLPVIARSSSYSMRGSDAGPIEIGARLGARYLLEGHLRSKGKDSTLSLSLSDCDTERIIWSANTPIGSTDSMTAVEDIISDMTSMLGLKIDIEEQRRALAKPQSDLNVRELIWRGRWHFNRLTKEDAEQARSYFARALEKEPNSPEALIQSTWASIWALWVVRGTDDDIRAVRQQGQKAIIADYDDARGHMLAGIAEIWLRQPLRAEALLRKAVELNPSLAMAYAQLGSALMLRGDAEEAIVQLHVAVRLSPNDIDLFFFVGELAMACLIAARYDDALEYAEQAISRRSAYWQSHVVKVNALINLDRMEEARKAWLDLKQTKRGFEPAHVDWIPFVDSHQNTKLKTGLNLVAGITD